MNFIRLPGSHYHPSAASPAQGGGGHLPGEGAVDTPLLRRVHLSHSSQRCLPPCSSGTGAGAGDQGWGQEASVSRWALAALLGVSG